MFGRPKTMMRSQQRLIGEHNGWRQPWLWSVDINGTLSLFGREMHPTSRLGIEWLEHRAHKLRDAATGLRPEREFIVHNIFINADHAAMLWANGALTLDHLRRAWAPAHGSRVIKLHSLMKVNKLPVDVVIDADARLTTPTLDIVWGHMSASVQSPLDLRRIHERYAA